jgi:hypothetical protein
MTKKMVLDTVFMKLQVLILTVSFTLMAVACTDSGSQDDIETFVKTREPKVGMSSECLKVEIDKVVIPYVELENIELQTALDYVVQRGNQCHPDAPFDFPFDFSAAAVDNDVTVTTHGTNVSYATLISQVCDQGGLNWEIKQGRIVIENRAHPQ